MPRKTPAASMADALHLEGQDRARYLAMQRQRAQRVRDKSRYEEITIKIPRERVAELRALVSQWWDESET